MPDRAALAALVSAAVILGAALGGCSQPGTQAPKPQAAKLSVGTGDISTACGYLEELTVFGGRERGVPGSIESMARTGAGKLASVYASDQTGIYQGESIGGVLGDTISLLHDCGLGGAAKTLERALARHR